MKPLVLAASLALVVPALAQNPKPKPQPTVGVKGASQLAGGAIRFGELFALKDGFTYQILSARYSLDPFEAYEPIKPDKNEKLLILTVAIKNNQRDRDNFFGEHVVQAVDSANQIYESTAYALKSKPGEGFSPTLKPGQGLGQGGADPVELAIKLPQSTSLVKLILKQGREGTSEEVLRFFLAGATEVEAGGKPDPKNLIAPLPAWAAPDALVPLAQLLPSNSYFFQLTGFSTASKLGETEAEEGKKWIFAHITVKNAWHKSQNIYDFSGGDAINELVLRDMDGEKHPASQLLKAKRDEAAEGELDAGEERAFRIAFQVPKDATFKTVLLGSPGGHRYLFDASAAGK